MKKVITAILTLAMALVMAFGFAACEAEWTPNSFIPIEKIELNSTSLTLTVGETDLLTVLIFPSDTTADKTVTWSVDDSSVATVDENGRVTARRVGQATVTATVDFRQATCFVNVKDPIPLSMNEWQRVFRNCDNYKYVGDTDLSTATIKIDGGTMYTYKEVYPNTAYNTPGTTTEEISYYAGNGIYYNFSYSPTEELEGKWLRQTYTATTAVDGHLIGPTMISQYESQLASYKAEMDFFADSYSSFRITKAYTYYCSQLPMTTNIPGYGEVTQILKNITVKFDKTNLESITFTTDEMNLGYGAFSPASTCTYSDFGKVKIDLPTEFVEWSGLLGDIVTT